MDPTEVLNETASGGSIRSSWKPNSFSHYPAFAKTPIPKCRPIPAKTGPHTPRVLAITWKRSFLDARRPSAVCVGRVPGAEGDQKDRSNDFGNHKWHTLDGVTTPSMASA
jgi:hypothetical protein